MGAQRSKLGSQVQGATIAPAAYHLIDIATQRHADRAALVHTVTVDDGSAWFDVAVQSTAYEWEPRDLRVELDVADVDAPLRAWLRDSRELRERAVAEWLEYFEEEACGGP